MKKNKWFMIILLSIITFFVVTNLVIPKFKRYDSEVIIISENGENETIEVIRKDDCLSYYYSGDEIERFKKIIISDIKEEESEGTTYKIFYKHDEEGKEEIELSVYVYSI